jgi:hypothetical protein
VTTAPTQDNGQDRSFSRRVKLSKAQSAEICEEIRDRVYYCYMFERDNRREAEIDLAFVAGDQWPQAVKQMRGNSRPMLTINQLPQFVAQVTNPMRQADIAIKVVGTDDQTDPQLADVYEQIIKQIEYQSDAKQVYVTGNEHQVKCGVGWWRVTTDYASDESFDQEIYLKRIRNPLSVYCDPASTTRPRAMRTGSRSWSSGRARRSRRNGPRPTPRTAWTCPPTPRLQASCG